MRIDGPQLTSSLSLNGTTITDLNVFATTASFNGLTGSTATTGSNLFKGTQTISGSILPAVNNTYDLGSSTQQFRHVYISSGSLYIDGTKVLGSTSQELQITTDVGQSFKILEAGSDTITLQSNDGNITLATSGGGDVILDPTTGIIALKGSTQIYAGNRILSSDGNAIHFGNGIVVTGSIVSTVTPLVSGSSQISYTGLSNVPSGIISGSSQLTSSYDSRYVLSGSITQTTWDNIANKPVGIASGSSQIDITGTTGYSTFSSSISNSINTLSSSITTTTLGIKNRVDSIEFKTGSYATTGSNNFVGIQTITGSLYISSDLVVQGSSSLQNITASAVNIGANIVNLNTANPAIRFAGLSVFDSGSIGGSGSFLYDAVQDEFIFIHRGDGTNITSSVALMGPQTYNNVGNESYPTNNRILKGTGNEHVGDSIISETGGGIGISGSLSITGSVLVGVDKGIIFDTSGASGNPEISIDSNVDLNFKNSAGLTNLKLKNNGDTILTGSISTTGNISINSPSSTQLNIYTSSVSTQNVMGEFWNGDYTSGTRNFIRVRNAVNSGSTMSSYFGQGQDGKTYIVSNDFTKNHIVIDGNSTFVGINKNTPNSQLDVNGNTTVTGSLVTTSNVGVGVTPSSWGESSKVIQIGARMSVYNDGFNNALFGNNTYFNGSNNIYINTAAASRFYLENTGAFLWQQAPSGTTGNAINFTTAMTLNESANLGLGTTDTQGFRLAVDGPNVSQGDVTTTIRVFDTTSATTGTGGGISFAGYFSGTSSIINTFSYIKGGKENSTGGDYASYLSFGTRINGGSPAERLRITSVGTVRPAANGTQDLGTSSLRWGTVYTSDLSLSNGIGDYTIVEGEEKLYLYNNKNNKVYSFVLQEEDPSTATPKKS
jgi:hypothetical protein